MAWKYAVSEPAMKFRSNVATVRQLTREAPVHYRSHRGQINAHPKCRSCHHNLSSACGKTGGALVHNGRAEAGAVAVQGSARSEGRAEAGAVVVQGSAGSAWQRGKLGVRGICCFT